MHELRGCGGTLVTACPELGPTVVGFCRTLSQNGQDRRSMPQASSLNFSPGGARVGEPAVLVEGRMAIILGQNGHCIHRGIGHLMGN
jgi:hypothetical protein